MRYRLMHAATAALVLACGWVALFASVFGKRALQGIYGGKPLPILTGVAVNGRVWIPIVFGSLFLCVIVAAIRNPRSVCWAWSVLLIVALVVTVILFGLTQPFATTDWGMR
jgi:hypothetical protein